MKSICCAAVIFFAGFATHSLAEVIITSRVSKAEAYANYIFNPSESYNESSTFNGEGVHSVVLRGHEHYSEVTSARINADFHGSSEQPSGSSIYDRDSLEVKFSVTGAPASVNLTLNGRALGGGNTPSNPTLINAYFLIYNADTNALIFDSWNIGVKVGSIPFDYRQWTNATWSSTFGIGNYRVLMSASGAVTQHVGPGFPASGFGELNVAMTIPTPAGAILLTLGLLRPARRR